MCGPDGFPQKRHTPALIGHQPEKEMINDWPSRASGTSDVWVVAMCNRLLDSLKPGAIIGSHLSGHGQASRVAAS
jgi:hypothetical protein